MSTGFKINRTFDFEVIQELINSVIFKNKYENMKLISILAAPEAMKYADVYTMHKNALENVTSGTLPTSANDCTFLLFKNSSDETFVIAEEYVESTTIKITSKETLAITIANVESEDKETILSFIRSLGYSPVY